MADRSRPFADAGTSERETVDGPQEDRVDEEEDQSSQGPHGARSRAGQGWKEDEREAGQEGDSQEGKKDERLMHLASGDSDVASSR